MSKHDVWTEGDRSRYVDYVMVERIITRIERKEDTPIWISHWLKFTQRVGALDMPIEFTIPVANPNTPWPGRPGKNRPVPTSPTPDLESGTAS